MDTPVVLWWLTDDPTLSEETKTLLDTEPDVWLSSAVVWEVVRMQFAGLLFGPPNLPERVRDSPFRPLPVTADHVILEGRLPPVHHDRFDRLLVAQAGCEGLTLVTRNGFILRYDVAVLPV